MTVGETNGIALLRGDWRNTMLARRRHASGCADVVRRFNYAYDVGGDEARLPPTVTSSQRILTKGRIAPAPTDHF